MTSFPKRSLSVFLLVMINVAATCSIKSWPLTAEYGLNFLFYAVLTNLFFFIPLSLVSAELATGWPKGGGVYAWVKAACGKKMGFLAIWLLWIENVVWYPTTLSFIAGTLAFVINPQLVHNTFYMFCVILGTFWGTTLITLLGMKISGWMSSLGVILGTIIPGVAIISLGMVWLFSGNPSHITFSWESCIPELSTPSQLSLITGILLGFSGIEMSAIHAREVKNPQKNFPKAIFFSALIIILLSLLGTLAVAVIIPKKEISLVSSGMEAIALFLKSYNLSFFVPIVATIMVVGALGAVSTWTAGPSKGLLAAAQDGEFPPILHKTNRHNMPVGILIFQGIIVSILSTLFLFMPNINSSFWILTVLTSQLYLLMYILMFMSGIILRYKKPSVHRAYKIPFGNVGMCLAAGAGLVGATFSIVIGFFPPEQLETGNPIFYVLFLAAGIVIFCAAPFIILKFKKPSWNERPPPPHTTNKQPLP